MTEAPDLPVLQSHGTHERLLGAALKIFSRDGLQGATTRAIAQEAGVSEVTLFRHFQAKERLLEELLATMVAAAAREQGHPEEREKWARLSLRTNLLQYAQRHYATLVTREAFVRTMIGEARRHPDYARKIIMDVTSPVRTELIANLATARKAGKVRKGVDLTAAAESFLDALLIGMLRQTAGCGGETSPEQFLATCVDIFAAGLTTK